MTNNPFPLSKEKLLEAYRIMRTIREFEERLHVDFGRGDIPGFVHLYAGEEAVEQGWFGAVEPQVRPRLGDVVVASLGDVAVVSSERFPHEAVLLGLHGSLTDEEMLVPLLVDAGQG